MKRALKNKEGKIVGFTLLDREDNRLLLDFTLRLHKDGWGKSYAKCKGVQLANIILWHPPGTVIDHINDNGLDNRRKNLEIVLDKENKRRSIKRKPRPIGIEGKRNPFGGEAILKKYGKKYFSNLAKQSHIKRRLRSSDVK